MPLTETPEAVAEFRSVQAALRLWWRDFERLIEYVEPVDAHEAVYSHRLFELLLRAATEFESVAKAYAHHSGIPLPPRPTIRDYHAVLSSLRLAEAEVGILHWRPGPRYVAPFASWRLATNSPDWYQAYNAAKHSRRSQFSQASLVQAITAAAAVFATLIMGFGPGLWPVNPQRVPASPPPKTVDLHFESSPFTLRVPWGAV